MYGLPYSLYTKSFNQTQGPRVVNPVIRYQYINIVWQCKKDHLPDEVSAYRAECWLSEEGGHEFMSIHLVYTAPQRSSPPI